MDYKAKKTQHAYPPDFVQEPDFDYCPDYPCQTCGRPFKSRYLLATHEHKKKVTQRADR